VKSPTLLQTAQERPVLLDGGMGTMLFERGLAQGQAPELWNLTAPEKVRQVHQAYLRAGSEAILTNTFGGTSIKLADSDLEDRAAEINRAGAEIARGACGEKNYVIGDIGPAGKILEPYGELTEANLRASFEVQISALLEGGVDALVFETQMDTREATIGVEVARSVTSLPVIVSLTFNKSKRGFFTLMGDSVKDAIQAAEAAGADMVGTNCSLDSNEMRDLVKEINLVTSKPIYAKANAGLPELTDGRVEYAQSVEDYMKAMPQYLDNGVRLIGGCCGTNPDYICALKEMLSGQRCVSH
jgi:5-methyltetrahydrofolate--homocysteine methyltransferase